MNLMAVWVGLFWFSSYLVTWVWVWKSATLWNIFNSKLPIFSFRNSPVAGNPLVLDIQQKQNHPEKTIQRKQMWNSDKGHLLENSDSKHASNFCQYLMYFQLELQWKVWRENITIFNTVFTLHKQCIMKQRHLLKTQAKQMPVIGPNKWRCKLSQTTSKFSWKQTLVNKVFNASITVLNVIIYTILVYDAVGTVQIMHVTAIQHHFKYDTMLNVIYFSGKHDSHKK